jgi:hypothetical protein
MRTFAIWTALIVAAAMLPACSSEDDTGPTGPQTTGDAPQLPAMSTMVFDVDFFGSNPSGISQQSIETGKPGDELQAAGAANRTNWINAFVRALYVQLIMFDALEEPIGAFALAIHSVPQQQEDGSWLWTYIFVEDGVEYSIFLYGTPGDTYVDWRMEVSTNDPGFPLDHFVWFSGRAQADDSEGYWQFYDPVFAASTMTGSAATPTPGVETIRIDWENPSVTEHRLTILVNGVGHEDEGDYVEFFESSLVGSITHYDAGEDLLSDITYYPDGSGSLTVPDYNNGEQACWDRQQFDTDCPQ